MKCKDLKQLMIHHHPQQMSDEESRLMEDHIKQCQECRKFQEDLRFLRLSLNKIKQPLLSKEIDRRTRHRCQKELEMSEQRKRATLPSIGWIPIPKKITVAVVALIAFTLVLTFPALGDFPAEGSLSQREIFTLILVVQNSLMLFLSPLLIRRYGRKIRGSSPGFFRRRESQGGV